ncbi:hypothetical protein DPMN_118054 [Dreissena polymorpha]|uniref:Uncharacterized protein n=1 Tax=Dreissena polymorpha TaxID=45954 RepID=A0A9D4GGN6_DREPO|nr:hypothetical protein DPMN_118054 [Dreissena polymorpha]
MVAQRIIKELLRAALLISEYRHPSTRTSSPADFADSQNLEGLPSGLWFQGTREQLRWQDNGKVPGKKYTIQLLTKFGEDRMKFLGQTDRQTDRQSDSYLAPITNGNGGIVMRDC